MKIAAVSLIALLAACSGSGGYETSWPDPLGRDSRAPQQAQADDIRVDEDYARGDDRGDRANAAAQCRAYGRVVSGESCVPASVGVQRERRPGYDSYP